MAAEYVYITSVFLRKRTNVRLSFWFRLPYSLQKKFKLSRTQTRLLVGGREKPCPNLHSEFVDYRQEWQKRLIMSACICCQWRHTEFRVLELIESAHLNANDIKIYWGSWNSSWDASNCPLSFRPFAGLPSKLLMGHGDLFKKMSWFKEGEKKGEAHFVNLYGGGDLSKWRWRSSGFLTFMRVCKANLSLSLSLGELRWQMGEKNNKKSKLQRN